MILVDTSVWILTEILQGIRDDHQYERVKNTLLQLNILHAEPVKTYIHAAEIYRTCRSKGFTVRKTNDCLIAAITIQSHGHLLHKDKDFEAIAQCVELQLYSSN